jgi:hypothetical protein
MEQGIGVCESINGGSLLLVLRTKLEHTNNYSQKLAIQNQIDQIVAQNFLNYINGNSQ